MITQTVTLRVRRKWWEVLLLRPPRYEPTPVTFSAHVKAPPGVEVLLEMSSTMMTFAPHDQNLGGGSDEPPLVTPEMLAVGLSWWVEWNLADELSTEDLLRTAYQRMRALEPERTPD